MPRILRTARGELVDFDAIQIKHQLAAAPMNIEVQRRKEFIDSKEGKARGAKKQPSLIEDPQAEVPVEAPPVVEIAPTQSKKK